MNTQWSTYESPLGPLTLTGGPAGLRSVLFPGRMSVLDADCRNHAPFEDAVAQLDEYFGGERRQFDLVLDLVGTDFQHRVWQALRRIPFGTTVSYSELAARLGHEDDARAVGSAVARTPTPIIVPCHRVIGANGALTGYGGGLDRKQALLDLESYGAGVISSTSALTLASI